jgi:hypothetical protein
MNPIQRVNYVCLAIAVVFGLVMVASVSMTAASIASKGVSVAEASEGAVTNQPIQRRGWK